MENSLTPNPAIPYGKPATAGDGAIGKVASGAHGVVDKASSAVDDAVRKARPVIDRVAEGAHEAVDKAARVAVPTVQWLTERGDSLNATQKQFVADARRQVATNPLTSVGIALAAGLVIGRFMR